VESWSATWSANSHSIKNYGGNYCVKWADEFVELWGVQSKKQVRPGAGGSHL
jgi:hypothetical protein